eukprot:gene33734-34652_t
MSVRTKASNEQVQAAERAYRQIREGGKTAGIVIKNGQLIHPGVGNLLSRLGHFSLAARIWAATSGVNTLLLFVCLASLFGDGASALTRYTIFGATFIGLLVNVFLWYTLRTSVLQPLGKALDGARAIAAGDLSGSFDT